MKYEFEITENTINAFKEYLLKKITRYISNTRKKLKNVYYDVVLSQGEWGEETKKEFEKFLNSQFFNGGDK